MRALTYCNKAVGLIVNYSKENKLALASVYSTLGKIHVELVRFDDAIHYTYKALSINKKHLSSSHPYIANNYTNLSTLHGSIYQWEKAITFGKKALKIRILALGVQHYLTAFAFNNLGRIYHSMGDLSKITKQYYKKSLAIKLSVFGEKHKNVSYSYINLAKFYLDRQKYKKAIILIQKALNSGIKEYSNSNNYHNPKLQNYFMIDNLAAFLYKQLIFFRLYVFMGGNVLISAALQTTQVALKWIDYIRQSFSNDGSKLTLAQKSYDIFKNGIKIAHHAARVAAQDPEAWQQATNEVADINHDSWPRDILNYCFTADDCLHTAFDICEKSRAMVLLGNIKDEEAKGQSLIPTKLLEKEYDLKVELNYYDKKIKQEEYKPVLSDNEGTKGRNETQLREWQSTFFDYKQEYDALIEQLEKDYPDYYTLKYRVETVEVKELQKILRTMILSSDGFKPVVAQNQAIIQYFIGDEHLYLFAITATQYETFEVEKPADFEDMVKDFLKYGIGVQNVRDIIKAEYTELGYELYELLIAPILKKIVFPQNKSLIIIPDGILSLLPFEALLTQKVERNTPYIAMPYLLKDYDISYHFSATLWYEAQQKKQTQATDTEVLADSFIGFAPVYVSKAEREALEKEEDEAQTAPPEATPSEAMRDIKIGDETYGALPSSKTEVENIAQLFRKQGKQAELCIYEAATTQNFIEKTPFYKYVLVAAHADFQVSRPDLTGIVFSPEAAMPKQAVDEFGIPQTYQGYILYLSDAYHLQLKSTNLVVLSCCETGIGKLEKGEGVMALHRGFLFAGAKNIIYTLCKVPDTQSSELTQALFRHILAGKSYRAALRQAKMDLIKQDSKPIYWSGFVLVGA